MKLSVAFIFALIATLSGCGDQKINLSSNSDSLERILEKMPLDERVAFLGDADLILKLKNDPFAINGYTVDQVRKEAEVGRRFVAEQNRNFIGPLIQKMEKNGSQSTVRLLVTSAGLYIYPEPGYHTRDFTLEKLRSIYLENGGDLATLKVKVVQEQAETEKIESLSDVVHSDGTYCNNSLPREEAEQIWKQMTTGKATYLKECQSAERDVAINQGGMTEGEAILHSKGVCEGSIAAASLCMSRTGAKASECICGADG